MTSKLVVNTIEADTGISSVSFASSISLSSTSKFHFSAAGIDIDADTNINRPEAGVIGFNINSSEKVRIDSSGRMGLGTNNPEEILHVKAASETVNSRDGVIFQSSSALAADTGLPLVFSSHIGNDPNYPVASIAGRKENASSGDGAGYLQFATGSSAGAITEKFRITSDGIIETGTAIGASGADGDQRLRVGRDGNCNIAVRATASTTAYTGIDFGDSGDDRAGRIQYMHNGDYMSFHTNGAGNGADNERLRIDSAGNLSLGKGAAASTNYGRNFQIHDTGTNGATLHLTTSDTGSSNSDGFHLVQQGSHLYHWLRESGDQVFATAATERVRIASGGKVKMTSTTANQRGLAVIAPQCQINFGQTEDKGGFLLSTTDGQFSISGGAYWTGSNWVATSAASTQIRHDGSTGPMKFCLDTGLTAGNTFVPTTRMELTPSGNLKISDPGITFSDSSPYYPVAWSGTDGYNTTFTIASTGYANLRFRGEQTSGTEYTMGVGAGIFYMAYDDINNGHRITVAANGVVSLNVNDTSDEKMKKNITSLADGAISRIKQLRPVNFDWKKDSDLNGQSGFIAQEIKTVIPDLVQGEEYVEGSIESVGYSVNTTGIVAHLTKALQEAITKIETLETKVAALEGS